VSVRSPTPSVAELRAVTQPASLFARNSGEHWAGKLYMRRLSPYLTRPLLRTRVTPNAVTWFMMVVGIAAAGVLTLPGLAAAAGALALVQFQLLLDCVDGEIARWQEKRSPRGVYLDQIAHHLTETAILIALGIRADGGWDDIGGYTSLGLLTAVLVLLLRMSSALIYVARAESGLGVAEDTASVAAPRVGWLAWLRHMVGYAPVYRAFLAIEFSFLALLAAIWDAAAGDLSGTRGLVVVLVPIGVFTVAGRLAAVITSARLR
jgi:phosphatidylglycerophosphate synthase